MTVVYVDPPTELVVSGSAVVRRDRDDAVARALLDATEPSPRARRARPYRALIGPRAAIRANLGVMPPVAVQLSYRLGGADGVAVEARKWEWALRELGFSVRRVAGELEDDRPADDEGLPFLAIDPPDAATPEPDRLAASLAGADLVVVENLCSLPINPDAASLAAEVLGRHEVGSSSTTTTCRGSGRGSPCRPTSRRTDPTRCTSPSTTTRASSSSAAASRR